MKLELEIFVDVKGFKTFDFVKEYLRTIKQKGYDYKDYIVLDISKISMVRKISVENIYVSYETYNNVYYTNMILDGQFLYVTSVNEEDIYKIYKLFKGDTNEEIKV